MCSIMRGFLNSLKHGVFYDTNIKEEKLCLCDYFLLLLCIQFGANPTLNRFHVTRLQDQPPKLYAQAPTDHKRHYFNSI